MDKQEIKNTLTETENNYVVLDNASYYAGDCQHPSGWELTVAQVDDEDCIGTLAECEEWIDQLNDGISYLAHGQAGISHHIAEIVDDAADYQSWLDGVDWTGCPGSNDDYDDNNKHDFLFNSLAFCFNS